MIVAITTITHRVNGVGTLVACFIAISAENLSSNVGSLVCIAITRVAVSITIGVGEGVVLKNQVSFVRVAEGIIGGITITVGIARLRPKTRVARATNGIRRTVACVAIVVASDIDVIVAVKVLGRVTHRIDSVVAFITCCIGIATYHLTRHIGSCTYIAIARITVPIPIVVGEVILLRQ